MEPVPLCKGEIILKIEHSGQIASLRPQSRVSSVIVPRAEDIAEVRKKLAQERPVGVRIDASLNTEEDTTSGDWDADWLIDQFREPVDKAIEAGADFLYLRMTQDLQVLRAAVLAATEVSGIGILTELPVDEEGRTQDGTSLMAAMGILQRIGVAGMMMTGDVEEVTDTIDELSPYAFMALGYAPDPLDVHDELPEAEFYLAAGEVQAEQLNAHIPLNDDTDEPDADRDYILAPVGRHAHFVDATIDISDPMDLEDRFEETLLEMEDVFSGAIKIEISSTEDIYLLAENQYLLERPVCLAAENPVLFEKALRIFNGIALYDHTWEIDEDVLDDFCRRYGLVVL